MKIKNKNILLMISILIAIVLYIIMTKGNTEVKNQPLIGPERLAASGEYDGNPTLNINKVDENGNPLEGAVFDISGWSKYPTVELENYYGFYDRYYRRDPEGNGILNLHLQENIETYQTGYLGVDDCRKEKAFVTYKIDLKEMMPEQYNLKIDFYGVRLDEGAYAYATVSDSKEIPGQNVTDGQIFKLENIDDSDMSFNTSLKGGKEYYLHIVVDNSGVFEDLLFDIGNIYFSFGQEVQQCTTDASGKIVIPVPEGKNLTVQEKQAPYGYKKSDVVEHITMEDENKELTFVNTLINKKVTINKIDDEGNPVEGAEFSITGADPKFSLGSYYALYKSEYSGTSNAILKSDDWKKEDSKYVYPKLKTSFTVGKSWSKNLVYSDFVVDLTDSSYPYKFIINTGISQTGMNGYNIPEQNGYVTIKDSSNYTGNIPDLNDTEGQLACFDLYDGINEYTKILEPGKSYHIYICDLIDVNQNTCGTLVVDSMSLEEIYSNNNKLITDENGQASINLPSGAKIKVEEIKVPEGYISADYSEDYTVKPEDNIITVINKRVKKIMVYHLLKDTENKVAETEEYTPAEGENYETSASNQVQYMHIIKDENGNEIIPENAIGIMGNKDINIYYYYEPDEIKFTVHHYLNGTTEKLAEDEVITVPLKVVQKEDGLYKVVDENGEYDLSENEEYNKLISQYNFVKVVTTEELSIEDLIKSSGNLEINYYYDKKEVPEENNEETDPQKDEDKDNDTKEEDSNEKKEENNKPKEEVAENKNEDRIEDKVEEKTEGTTEVANNVQTGDNIVKYVIALIAAVIVLCIAKQKGKTKIRGKH